MIPFLLHWSSSRPFESRMESLELPRLFLHHPRASSAPTRPHAHSTTNSSRFLPQLGFPSKLKKPIKNATLRSISGASQDGPISFEDETQQLRHQDEEEDEGRLLSREIDDFGSLVAFRLTPHNASASASGIYSFPFHSLFSKFLLSSYALLPSSTSNSFARLIQFPYSIAKFLLC